tara:strand:+ start:1613 stop:2287 length:675 start_codon:yes stop_codon:yes gene_type:complete
MTIPDIFSSWSTPSPLAGSGFDSRSSENGLLVIMYGSLEHAAQFGWLNAGRTLVDKTYIRLLWQAKQLPTLGLTHHDIATQLELFIRAELQPKWAELKHLTPDEADQQAKILVRLAAHSIFGSVEQEVAASWLLYYLCPQLPIFPIAEYCRKARLLKPLSDEINTYDDYHRASKDIHNKLRLHYEYPKASYGNNKEQVLIEQLLHHSDWWSRQCFHHYLLTWDK